MKEILWVFVLFAVSVQFVFLNAETINIPNDYPTIHFLVADIISFSIMPQVFYATIQLLPK